VCCYWRPCSWLARSLDGASDGRPVQAGTVLEVQLVSSGWLPLGYEATERTKAAGRAGMFPRWHLAVATGDGQAEVERQPDAHAVGRGSSVTQQRARTRRLASMSSSSFAEGWDLMSRPTSADDPRSGGRPVDIAPNCPGCGGPLALLDHVQHPSAADDEIRYDEWALPTCRGGIWPDWPQRKLAGHEDRSEDT
jgi:hypothetical protein